MAEKKSHRRPPIPVIVLLVLALIGGGLWWWWSSTQAESAAAAATLSGNVEADQYQITPALAGRVTAVMVAEGDQVKRGDTLVKLDTKALKLQLSQAKEGVNAAKAAVKNAKNDSSNQAYTEKHELSLEPAFGSRSLGPKPLLILIWLQFFPLVILVAHDSLPRQVAKPQYNGV